MRKMLFALVLVALSGSVAQAQKPVYWMTPSFGLNTYAMDDVNTEIRFLDDALPGSMDEIESGWSYGVAFGVDLPSRLSLAVGYERFFASTDYGDPSGSLDYDFAANVLKGSLLYRLSPPGLREFAVGFSFGMISSAGEVAIVDFEEGAFKGDVEGSSPLLEGFLAGDFRLTPKVALAGTVGYRIAEVDEIEIEGIPVTMPDGSDYTVDYGGLLLRVGLKIWL